MPPESSAAPGAPSAVEKITLVCCQTTTLEFADTTLTIEMSDENMRISKGGADAINIVLKDQKVPYKLNILGSVVLEEQKLGDMDYADYFSVNWEDEFSAPVIVFKKPPLRIARVYTKGQRIELGIENVAGYRVEYSDGVVANFDRKSNGGFEFSFSTGFYGNFAPGDDGSYTLTFKGDKLRPDEEEYRSQSKFIVSRSKYTGNMLLILEEDAIVEIK